MSVGLNGKISKIRYIAQFPKELVRFTLIHKNNHTNCIAHGEIARRIMMTPEQSVISTHGHYNKRKQFVVDKLSIRDMQL